MRSYSREISDLLSVHSLKFGIIQKTLKKNTDSLATFNWLRVRLRLCLREDF